MTAGATSPACCNWPPAPPGTPLAPGDVHVWCLDLDAPLAADALASLAPAERAACERVRLPQPRARAFATRALARVLLAGYLQEAPHRLAFERGAHGKPRLAGAGGPSFNLAHSGGVALLAVTQVGEVGVDVEAVPPDLDVEELAAGFCSPPELERLAAAPPAGRAALVIRWWARKEAVLKAIGRGLATEPRTFAVCDELEDGRVSVEPSPSAHGNGVWSIDLDGCTGHAASLALHAAPAAVHRFVVAPAALLPGPLAQGYAFPP